MKNKFLIINFIYLLIMLGFGIWQILDWYYGSEDPIWHLFFYFLFIPFASALYGCLMGDSKRWYLVPFVSYFATCTIYIFFANGGYKGIDFGAFELSIIPFVACIGGVVLRKIIEFIDRKI